MDMNDYNAEAPDAPDFNPPAAAMPPAHDVEEEHGSKEASASRTQYDRVQEYHVAEDEKDEDEPQQKKPKKRGPVAANQHIHDQFVKLAVYVSSGGVEHKTMRGYCIHCKQNQTAWIEASPGRTIGSLGCPIVNENIRDMKSHLKKCSHYQKYCSENRQESFDVVLSKPITNFAVGRRDSAKSADVPSHQVVGTQQTQQSFAWKTPSVTLDAKPEPVPVDLERTALLIIDMQRGFLEPGMVGSKLGNDVTYLQRAVAPCRALLGQARESGLLVIHTREGHRPDLKDLHPTKRQRPGNDVGELGPSGRVLVRGEPGHDITAELAPILGQEPVIDKPGKGSFYATELECILRANDIKFLLVCGVTTEVGVHSTVREASDRGFYCVVISNCCASYSAVFHEVALQMIHQQWGIFGSITDLDTVLKALAASKSRQI